jgi:hypothetical protein
VWELVFVAFRKEVKHREILDHGDYHRKYNPKTLQAKWTTSKAVEREADGLLCGWSGRRNSGRASVECHCPVQDLLMEWGRSRTTWPSDEKVTTLSLCSPGTINEILLCELLFGNLQKQGGSLK